MAVVDGPDKKPKGCPNYGYTNDVKAMRLSVATFQLKTT